MATPPPIRDPMNSQRWLEWFRLISQELQDLTNVNWSDIIFTGSNLTDIATRNHNQLQNIDGGTTNEYYHLTSAQHNGLTGGGNADAYHTHSSAGLANIVEDTSPQLGGTLDANGNIIDMGINNITDTAVGQWITAYGWGDHSTEGYLTTVALNGISDVTITTPADNEVLAYNGAGAWINQTPAEAGLAEASHTHATTDITSGTFADARIAESNVTQHQAALSITESQISDLGTYLTDITGQSIKNLSDVYTTMSPIDGQVLTYDTTNGWQAETPASGVTDHTLLSNIGTNTHAQIDSHIADSTLHFTQASISITESQISDLGSYLTSVAINDVTDITITTPADNEVLAYNSGTATWINQTAAETGLAAASHTHTASDITDFDTEVSNNASVTANTAKVSCTTANVTAAGALMDSEVTNLAQVKAFSSADYATAAQGALADSALQDITGQSIKNLSDVLSSMTPTDGQVLTYDTTNGWQAETISSGGLGNVVEDTTPQLGGNLDVNGNSIVSASAGNIAITPDTTGSIVLDGLNWPQSDGTNTQVLQTNGAGQLSWADAGGDSYNIIDNSDATFLTVDISENAVFTAGLTCGTFTSTGIDDNTTGERIQISDSILSLGTSGAAYYISHPAADQAMFLNGGNSFLSGSYIGLYGQSHATTAFDVLISKNGGASGNMAKWDDSNGSWSFSTGTGTLSNALFLDSAQNATIYGNLTLSDASTPGLYLTDTTNSNSSRIYTDDNGSLNIQADYGNTSTGTTALNMSIDNANIIQCAPTYILNNVSTYVNTTDPTLYLRDTDCTDVSDYTGRINFQAGPSGTPAYATIGYVGFNSAGVLGVNSDGDVSIRADDANADTNTVVNIYTDNTKRFEVETNGTLTVGGTANYETLVTADDDIPNKKYVDDAIASGGGSYNITDNSDANWLTVDLSENATFTGNVSANGNIYWDSGTHNAYLGTAAGGPLIVFDSNDYLAYNKTSNRLDTYIGGATKFRIDDTYLTSYTTFLIWDSGPYIRFADTSNNSNTLIRYNAGETFISCDYNNDVANSTFAVYIDGNSNQVFQIESNGTLNVSGTTDYENLVTADDDIPNRKFITDSYAPLASPALTGSPTAPTQTANDNSTKIATTAYVDAAAGGGGGAFADVQTFTSSGTWTKPSSGTWARIECWGGGGSGASDTNDPGGGGGGGAYKARTILLSSLGSTETVTVGAGGAGVNADNDGNSGGNTSFGSHVTARGGGGGGVSSSGGGGGGGGGYYTKGGSNTGSGAALGGRPYENLIKDTGSVDRIDNSASGEWWDTVGTDNLHTVWSFVGGGHGLGHELSGRPDDIAYPSLFGGGGGGSADDDSGSGGTGGGMSIFGGGGGGAGARDSNPGPGAGGPSMRGGHGGAGSHSGTAATAGEQPGGGGGGAEGGLSGAGGAGMIVITVW